MTSPSLGSDGHGRVPVSLRVRTAPKFWPFIGAGFVLGAIAALVVTWAGYASAGERAGGTPLEFSFGSTFGFFLVLLGVIGVAVGAIAFLIVDRIGRARAKTISAVEEPPGASFIDGDTTPNA